MNHVLSIKHNSGGNLKLPPELPAQMIFGTK